MTPAAALAALRAAAEPGRAAEMARYHKQTREVLGVANAAIEPMVRDWRRALPLDQRIPLAAALWESDIFEARIAAAKLLTQARMKPAPQEEAAWRLIASWVGQFDSWAIADHAAMAGQRRLEAVPDRLNEVEGWTRSPHMWVRRAALVMTLPWARMRHPDAADAARRERILGWAAGYTRDPEWFIQKAVGWWLRDLSKRDPNRVRAFLADHGPAMKPFARREASRYL
jgi:3-methyladenine DNA glycosylase AlkD